MAGKSHDQKRKAKLAKRAKKSGPEIEPYSGAKYRADAWAPYVYATELAVYETIKLSNRRLTNKQVHAAFTKLVLHLRAGRPPLLAVDELVIPYVEGGEIDYLVSNIRQHWRSVMEENGAIPVSDWTGILRTLLYSMEAQAWSRGPDRGYVSFIEEFIERF